MVALRPTIASATASMTAARRVHIPLMSAQTPFSWTSGLSSRLLTSYVVASAERPRTRKTTARATFLFKEHLVLRSLDGRLASCEEEVDEVEDVCDVDRA